MPPIKERRAYARLSREVIGASYWTQYWYFANGLIGVQVTAYIQAQYRRNHPLKTLRLLTLTAALGASFLPSRCAGQAPLKILYKFGMYPDAQTPQGLCLGPNGTFYGASANGGLYGYGTVFELQPPSSPGGAWTETVLYSFAPQNGDGQEPATSPVMGPNGTIVGTTAAINSYGAVYQVQPPVAPGGTWTETTLFRAEYSSGIYYLNGVVAAGNGEVYGVAGSGGSNFEGAVYELTPPTVPGGEWTESVIYSFGARPDGESPTGLIMTPKGVIYGTTNAGGSLGLGTIFELIPPVAPGAPWTEKVLYSFLGTDSGFTDGAAPTEPPSQDSQGNLYGSTSQGGSAGLGTVWELQPPARSSSEIEKFWTESVLYSFETSGQEPSSPLIVRNNMIYGTTAASYSNTPGGGYVFELQPPATPGLPWTESILHEFTGQPKPVGRLVVDKNGALFGTTNAGADYDGERGNGSVYSTMSMQGGVQ